MGARHPRSHQKSNSSITLSQDSQKLRWNLLSVLTSQIMDLTETSSLIIRDKHQCICRTHRCRCHRTPMLRVSSMACHTDRDIKVWVQDSIRLTFKLRFIPISDPRCPIMEDPCRCNRRLEKTSANKEFHHHQVMDQLHFLPLLQYIQNQHLLQEKKG